MWPKQSECDTFYGNPRSKDGTSASLSWQRDNLVRVVPPFEVRYAGHPIKGITIHKKCFASLERVLNAAWIACGKDQHKIDESGLSTFSGSFNFRLMRGRNVLSMHSYGCAIDFDAERNDLGSHQPSFAKYPWVIKAFEDEGWVWGGRWPSRPDGMHFQAARV